MLCLGLFVFELDTLSYQELQRRSSWKHATQALVGARNASQYLGPGDDIITLTGVVLPEFKGHPASLGMLRAMADQGAAWVLVEGTGTLYGAFVITELQETHSLFYVTGEARRIEFTITLQRVDQETQDVSGLVAESMGELGTLLQDLDGSLGGSLGSLGASLGGGLGASLGGRLGGSLGSSLGGLGSSIGGNIGGSLGGSVGTGLGNLIGGS